MDIQNSPTYQRIDSQPNETKLCIIIDSKTPIVVRVPVPPGLLTLSSFKAHVALSDERYKFYFKSHDSEFGTVKEELVDDDSPLPVENGRIVVWAISNSNQNQSTLFGSENPYDKLGEDFHFHESDHPSVYKQPAAIKSDQIGSQEHVYDRMVTPQPTNVLTNLYLSPRDALGLTILCPSGEADCPNGLVVDKVALNSVAARDGSIRPGDRIIELNGVDLRSMSADRAIMLFKRIVDNKGAINLFLHRDGPAYQSNGPYRPVDQFNATKTPIKLTPNQTKAPNGTGFDPATELPMPIFDPDVLSTPDRYIQRRNNASHRTAYSLPRSLTPRSLYATSNFDTLTSSNDLRMTIDSQSVYGPSTPSSLRQIGVALHCSKDSIGTIYAYLKSDATSLDIRDREWLKVVVKDAFLGSTLVKWLSRNVYGFCNRSETKRFANRMLNLGLIKSPVSSGQFSDKCYYVLT